MAVYKIWRVPLIPTRALEAGGAEAGPDPDGNFPSEDELMRNEKGQLEVFYKTVSSGAIAYTDEADYESLSDEDKANSTYSPFPSYFAQHLRFEFATPDGEKFTGVEKYEPKRTAKRRGSAASSENRGSTKQPENPSQ